MLTQQQLETAERLLVGIECIAEAVNRLNDLARAVPGVKPVSLRFGNSPRFYGEFEYSSTVNEIISNTYMLQILATIPEKQAA